MRHFLPIAGATLALALTSASAYAAPNFDPHQGNARAAAQQTVNGRGMIDNHNAPNNNYGHNAPGNFAPKPAVPPRVAPKPAPVVQGYNNWQPNNNAWNAKPAARPNFDRYRGSWQAQQRFRAGAFRAPSNFTYRRLSYGQRLPFAFLASNFWLSNAPVFGLFAPPQGLVWVRYGSDALLVDRVTGDIVQVRYNMFY